MLHFRAISVAIPFLATRPLENHAVCVHTCSPTHTHLCIPLCVGRVKVVGNAHVF